MSGTLDQVSSTVSKVTGGTSHSSGSKASSPRSSSTHHAPTVSVRRTVVKPVVRPVVRTVQRAAEPVVRVAPTPAKHVVTHADRTTQSVAKPAVKKSVKRPVKKVAPALRADRTVRDVTRDLLSASVRPASVAVSADVATVSTTVLSDVTTAVLPTSLAVPSVLPPLGVSVDLGLELAPVDLGLVTLPGAGIDLGLPEVLAPVEVPGLPGAPAAGVAVPTGPGTGPLTAQHAASVTAARSSSAGTPVLLLSPRSSAATGATHMAPGPDLTGTGAAAVAVDAGLSLLAGLGAAGTGLGAATDASAGAAGPGLVLLALVAVAGLVGPTALRPQPAQGRSGHLSRLLRQPGFSPD